MARKVNTVLGSLVVIPEYVIKHVLLRHPELIHIQFLENTLASVLISPDFIVEGKHKELIALKFVKDLPLKAKYLVVVYEENKEVITAFATSKERKFARRKLIWKR